MALFLRRIIVSTIVVLLFTVNLFAQATANATVSATISDVVGTINLSNIDFGIVSIKSKSGTIDYTSERITETPSFTIVGADHAYAITLPASKIILKRMGGNETIEVNSFDLSELIDNETNKNISFCSVLKIQTLPMAGHYRSSNPLPVTVHYN